MRILFILAIICLHTFSFSQIIFKEVTPPEMFNLRNLRKSPTGEYFIQATNDMGNIYSSLNGLDWTKQSLGTNQKLEYQQFFDDGTPVFKNQIRRNGVWYNLSLGVGHNSLFAGFVKNDTLFGFQNETFAYSLDKGQTFITTFVYPENILANISTHLWKWNNYYVLFHTQGVPDYISIFSLDGTRVGTHTLDSETGQLINTICGEILLIGKNKYYLLKEDGLNFSSGDLADLHPNFTKSSDILSLNGNYYFHQGNTMYKTNGCNFDWEVLETNDVIASNEDMWINQNGDIILYNQSGDSWTEKAFGLNIWEQHQVNISFPYILYANESSGQHQVSLSPTNLYRKTNSEMDWVKIDTSQMLKGDVHYAADGDLYIARPGHILHSTNNGITFSVIQLPESFDFYSIRIIENDAIFILGNYNINYYSLNNGQDWISVSIPVYLPKPDIKLVDNHIIVADLNHYFRVTKIDILSNESITDTIEGFFAGHVGRTEIMDDGTMYFYFSTRLYRYRFNEDPEEICYFVPLASDGILVSVGQNLYDLDRESYYVFDGLCFSELSYIGLPEEFVREIILSENNYVYVIIDQKRIFRSLEPLSEPNILSGSVFHKDQGCVIDTADNALAYWQIKVENQEQSSIRTTNKDGDYSIAVPAGQYTLSANPINHHWELCEDSYSINIGNGEVLTQHFLATSESVCAELDLDFSTPLLRRCFENYYSFRIRNTGPQASLGTTLLLELDPFMDSISVTVPYTQVAANIIKLDLGILSVNQEINFRITFTLSCDAELGTEHCITGDLMDDGICPGSGASFTECQENIGSFDPNDKRVFNANGDEVTQLDKGEYIYYHIRFQNTGTDTAFNIRIEDVLKTELDLSTFEMLSSSHPYTHRITGHSLLVIFDNILLPDSSTNEPASQGYFKFRVKPMPNLPYGTFILNQAGIYFDFNEPVLTNEATFTLLPPVGTKEIQNPIRFNVFPNPAKDVLFISLPELEWRRFESYEIFDNLGRSMFQNSLSQNAVDISQLNHGIYTIVLKETGEIRGLSRFIKN